MRHNNPTDQALLSAEEHLEGLIAKLEPQHQKLIRSVRKMLRKRLPTVNELVYDYGKKVVISYSPNERGIDAVVALSADADGVRLFFNQGPSLPDPHKILRGNGRQTRHIHLEASSVLLRPEVESLLTAAVAKLSVPLSISGVGGIIIKSSKRRPTGRPVKPTSSGTRSGR